MLTNKSFFATILPMIAVIKTGGKQYLVQPGDKIKVEKLDDKEGTQFTFGEVLLYSDGEKSQIGNPLVKGAKVHGEIIRHGKGEKLIIFKYKPKKRYKRKIGHRQPFTEVQITKIES